ncbi:hypothetical protein BDR03DRAFT_950975 [Suillus americanus]|nr:hypothetical protein BDR03DRAFT_950975 [Suillus americanus]
MPRRFHPSDLENDNETRRFLQTRSEERIFIDEKCQNVLMNLEPKALFPKQACVICRDVMLAIRSNLRSPKVIVRQNL